MRMEGWEIMSAVVAHWEWRRYNHTSGTVN